MNLRYNGIILIVIIIIPTITAYMKSNGFIENKVYIREPTKLKISSYPIYTGNKIISRKRIPLTANIQTYTNAIYPNKTIEISLVVSSLKPLPNAKLLLEIKNGKLMLPGNTIYIPPKMLLSFIL